MEHSIHSYQRGGRRLGYLLFLPPEHGTGQKTPLIMFMHGAGERGYDPTLLLRQGLPKYIEETRPDFPFVTISPQCPESMSWEGVLDVASGLLDQTMKMLPIDPARVYLTGISMGGCAAWLLGVMRPDTFAAVVPICGYGISSAGFPKAVCALRDVPVWVFHGARDRIVPPEESEVLVDVLTACGGNVRFTLYPDAEHDSWTRTYENPDLYDWLLAQRRAPR